MEISVTVNGSERSADVEPRMLLAHVIREEFGLTGTHVGCDTTSCGACTVLLDGSPVKSCTMFGVQADGREVTTVEGLADAAGLHPVQAAFEREQQLGHRHGSNPLVGVPPQRFRRFCRLTPAFHGWFDGDALAGDRLNPATIR